MMKWWRDYIARKHRERVEAQRKPAPKTVTLNDLLAELRELKPDSLFICRDKENKEQLATHFAATVFKPWRMARSGDLEYIPHACNKSLDLEQPEKIYVWIGHQPYATSRISVSQVISELEKLPLDLLLADSSDCEFELVNWHHNATDIRVEEFNMLRDVRPDEPGYLPGNRRYEYPARVRMGIRDYSRLLGNSYYYD